jgi:hypothetical protein
VRLKEINSQLWASKMQKEIYYNKINDNFTADEKYLSPVGEDHSQKKSNQGRFGNLCS